ncbi:MAG: TIGR03557 family F420-dependent LLM class oxidoreductase [Chloroflexota bacterium]
MDRASGTPIINFVLSHEQFAVSDLLDFGVAAEQAGFDGIATSDHFQPWQDNQGHAGFAWATLAALTQRTSRIHFGTAVTCPSFRYQPAIVAQAFATLSQLAPGRVYLGIGSGEALNEEAACGTWGKYEERAERMVEAVSVIRQLWTGEEVNHQGTYFQVHGRLYDPPAQPIPLYIAAAGPRSMAIAARYGDGLVAGMKEVLDQSARTSFHDEARKAGKDPDSLPIMTELFVVVGDRDEASRGAELWRFHPKGMGKSMLYDPDPRSIQRKAQDIPLQSVYQDWQIGADPEAHAQAIRKAVNAGAVIVNVHSVQADQKRAIEFYGRDVLPRLR